MALLACAVATVAAAGSLQVSPILLEFGAGDPARELWLSNSGQTPIRAQVRIEAWTQVDGADVLNPTRELLASPPITEIAPGERQLVRIVRPGAANTGGEKAYRLLVDELPDASRPDTTSKLQFLLKYSIPAFVLRAGAKRGEPAAKGTTGPWRGGALEARVESGNNRARLVLVNHGLRRVRISQVAFVDATGTRHDLVKGLVGYALAGQRMSWPLALPAGSLAGTSLMLRLDDDADDQVLPLVAAGP
jgi:fimbrial chaperone protein